MSGTWVAPPLAMTVAQFRNILPEFADSSVYKDEMVAPWIWVAGNQLDPGRWNTMYHVGIAWFVAHQLALGRQAQLTSRRGGAPGLSTGPISSKSINGVSVAFDTGLGGLEGAGDWNLSTYGIRFLNFARMFGSGGVQIGGGPWEGNFAEGELLAGDTAFPII